MKKKLKGVLLIFVSLIFMTFAFAGDRFDPPGPPLNLTCTDVSPNDVGLQWEPPRDDGGTPILYYLVEIRYPNYDEAWRPVGGSSEGKVVGLSTGVWISREGSVVEFRVRAVNRSGSGESTKPVMVTLPIN